MKKVLFICTILVFVTASCKKLIEEDDEFTLEKREFTGENLRLDGAYYFVNDNTNPPIFPTFVFYRNGIVRSLSGLPSTDEVVDFPTDSKLSWGIFNVIGDIIKFERLYANSLGPFIAITEEGEILNDTSFIMKESYRMLNGKKTELKSINRQYIFRPYHPKPDSTNTFID